MSADNGITRHSPINLLSAFAAILKAGRGAFWAMADNGADSATRTCRPRGEPAREGDAT